MLAFCLLHMPKFSISQDGEFVDKLTLSNEHLVATSRNLNGGSTGNDILDFIAHLGMLYSVAPQQIQKFPPEVVPQPGDILGGAGALLADAFQVFMSIYILCVSQ